MPNIRCLVLLSTTVGQKLCFGIVQSFYYYFCTVCTTGPNISLHPYFLLYGYTLL